MSCYIKFFSSGFPYRTIFLCRPPLVDITLILMECIRGAVVSISRVPFYNGQTAPTQSMQRKSAGKYRYIYI